MTILFTYSVIKDFAQMSDTPHDSWAGVYDQVYESSFGEMYKDLTKITVDFVKANSPFGSRILDIGAGTGRMSIPLSELGYQITAVDASKEMLNVLKAKDIDNKIEMYHSKLQDLPLDKNYDAVLCVFSVFCYITEWHELTIAIEKLSAMVKPGGFAFIDIPSYFAFSGRSYSSKKLERSVQVKPTKDDETLFEYKENVVISASDGQITYKDEFMIRYWDPEIILDLIKNLGMRVEYDATSDFAGSGAHYYKLAW